MYSIFELATPLAPGSFLLLASLGNLTKASQTWCYVVSIISDVVSFFFYNNTVVFIRVCYTGAELNKMV